MDERREYDFDEWVCLSTRERRRIAGKEWDPANPSLGEETRKAILEGFSVEHSYLMGKAVAGTAYFRRAGWCIGVVVANPRVKVPRHFDIFSVIKGVATDLDNPFRGVKWLAR
jgi:hypothetical protein